MEVSCVADSGDDDRNVAFSQTVRMAAALRTQGVEFEEHVFPDEIHGFLMHRSWVIAYGLTSDFFGRHFGVATSESIPKNTEP